MDINDRKFQDFANKYLEDIYKDFDKDIEWELGITGDDALEMLELYQQTFDVDLSEFSFPIYFHDEVFYFLFFFRKLFKIRKKEKLTFNDLLRGVIIGVLN